MQLIKGILRVPPKLLKYFNGTAIFASVIPALLVLPNILDLNFNDLDSVITALFNGGLSLQYFHKISDGLE